MVKASRLWRRFYGVCREWICLVIHFLKNFWAFGVVIREIVFGEVVVNVAAWKTDICANCATVKRLNRSEKKIILVLFIWKRHVSSINDIWPCFISRQNLPLHCG